MMLKFPIRPCAIEESQAKNEPSGVQMAAPQAGASVGRACVRCKRRSSWRTRRRGQTGRFSEGRQVAGGGRLAGLEIGPCTVGLHVLPIGHWADTTQLGRTLRLQMRPSQSIFDPFGRNQSFYAPRRLPSALPAPRAARADCRWQERQIRKRCAGERPRLRALPGVSRPGSPLSFYLHAFSRKPHRAILRSRSGHTYRTPGLNGTSAQGRESPSVNHSHTRHHSRHNYPPAEPSIPRLVPDSRSNQGFRASLSKGHPPTAFSGKPFAMRSAPCQRYTLRGHASSS